jgi:pimeloyl-ACP methyl ester carboxylesterase
VKIAWSSTGDGPPLLLVQGLGYGAWGWDPVAPGLAERFRVLTFDNRGIGASDKPAGPYTAAEMAGDALQVLDEAGVERAHLVGASLGGMIAQELAVAAPERVDRLVLCCTTPGGSDAFPLPEQTVKLFQEAAALEPQVALRRFVENALAPGVDGVADEVFARRLANPPDPAGWQGQAAAGTTFAGVDLALVQAPTLVLHGTADNVVDHRNAALLGERIAGARVELVEGGGHLFFWERPEAFVRILAEFLAA